MQFRNHDTNTEINTTSTKISTREKYPFLVLAVSAKKCSFYKFDTKTYTKISHGPESIAEVINDAPQKVSNFSDPIERKEVNIHKFLHRIDQWLGELLLKDPLPVFILAPHKINGHFKKMTKHKNAFAGHIHGNFDDLKLAQLKLLMKPYADRLIFFNKEK